MKFLLYFLGPTVGSSDFVNVAKHCPYFVDKTLMIKKFIDDDSQVILITRPHRWGKSLNMNMAKTFHEKELDEWGQESIENKERKKNFFMGLKISQHPECMGHLGKYPVIFINFMNVFVKRFIKSFSKCILKLYRQHKYILYCTDPLKIDEQMKEEYI